MFVGYILLQLIYIYFLWLHVMLLPMFKVLLLLLLFLLLLSSSSFQHTKNDYPECFALMRWQGFPYLCIISHRHADGGIELLHSELCICVFLRVTRPALNRLFSAFRYTTVRNESFIERPMLQFQSESCGVMSTQYSTNCYFASPRNTPSHKTLQRSRELVEHC